jgi:hypothetical protein
VVVGEDAAGRARGCSGPGTCKTRRKDASTEQPEKKRATLLAFGEIGYGGGLGEVASAAVIG